jgi:hypothetical protein
MSVWRSAWAPARSPRAVRASQGPQGPLDQGKGLARLPGSQQGLPGPCDRTVCHHARRRGRVLEGQGSCPEIAGVEEPLPDGEAPVGREQGRRGVLPQLQQGLPGISPGQQQIPHQERQLGSLRAPLARAGRQLRLSHLHCRGALEPGRLEQPLRLAQGARGRQHGREKEAPPGMEEPAGTPTRARPGTTRGGQHEGGAWSHGRRPLSSSWVGRIPCWRAG